MCVSVIGPGKTVLELDVSVLLLFFRSLACSIRTRCGCVVSFFRFCSNTIRTKYECVAALIDLWPAVSELDVSM